MGTLVFSGRHGWRFIASVVDDYVVGVDNVVVGDERALTALDLALFHADKVHILEVVLLTAVAAPFVSEACPTCPSSPVGKALICRI